MIRDRKMLEEELKTLKKSYHDLLEANIKLADEKKWAIEDKERALNRINRALAYVEAEKETNNDNVRKALDKYEKIMKEMLENDFYEC